MSLLGDKAINEIKKINSTKFFRNLGYHIQDSNVLRVENLELALLYLSDPYFTNLDIFVRNKTYKELNSTKRSNWNEIVSEVRNYITNTVYTNILEVFGNLPVPNSAKMRIKSSLSGDLVMYCLMIDNGIRNTFHENLIEWYYRGHFPCGWVGPYPSGVGCYGDDKAAFDDTDDDCISKKPDCYDLQILETEPVLEVGKLVVY